MKWIFTLLVAALFAFNTQAQKVEIKKGIVMVDDQPYVTLEVKKQNFGLTKSFEVFSMGGKKLIIAAPATEFESDKNDNTYLFYRLTFLTSNQVGIFKVSSLGQEKSFAKLIGQSGIVTGDATDDNKVKEFIASKGASPSIAVDYTMVPRSRNWPISLKEDKTIEQNSKIIGQFKPTGTIREQDYYEFSLPSGVIVAKISFAGGNNAQNMEVFTAKDNLKRVVPMKDDHKIIVADASIDKNQFMLRRVVKWLVDNQYL
ncbi:MAG TPA: hypothetical protein PKY29_08765 [Ferruginibacter sp.]|nr:hypothetical protein [Ferruginibacter sp.]HRN79715.1 hypothetical protein [Ferruginibacter sp.]HRO18190.1 hypothetical protein [Ferruginibacter sp.]HRQ21393.1 hypothetical protein [Ferruginibacter sp.]